MVHNHFPEAIRRRRERAEHRGYLRARPSDVHYVAVPAAIADRARSCARSLHLHSEHNKMADNPSHYARIAAIRAGISGKELTLTLMTHHSANRAKHAWFKEDPVQTSGSDIAYENAPWVPVAASYGTHSPESDAAPSVEHVAVTNSSSSMPCGDELIVPQVASDDSQPSVEDTPNSEETAVAVVVNKSVNMFFKRVRGGICGILPLELLAGCDVSEDKLNTVVDQVRGLLIEHAEHTVSSSTHPHLHFWIDKTIATRAHEESRNIVQFATASRLPQSSLDKKQVKRLRFKSVTQR